MKEEFQICEMSEFGFGQTIMWTAYIAGWKTVMREGEKGAGSKAWAESGQLVIWFLKKSAVIFFSFHTKKTWADILIF